MINPPQGLIAEGVSPGAAGSGLAENNGALDVQAQSGLNVNAGDDAVEVASSGITSAMIAPSAVGTGRVSDSTVTTRKVANSTVTTRKVADSTVTTRKIPDSQVTAAKVTSSETFALGGLLMRGTTDLQDSALVGVETSPSAVSAGDLSVGQVIIEEATPRIAWKDATGSAWVVSATAQL